MAAGVEYFERGWRAERARQPTRLAALAWVMPVFGGFIYRPAFRRKWRRFGLQIIYSKPELIPVIPRR